MQVCYNAGMEVSGVFAIIREGEGRFYTSMVFGCYRPEGWDGAYHAERIVLNREKTALVRQSVFRQGVEHLDLLTLVVDADQSGWRKASEHCASVEFLPTEELPAWVSAGAVPEELLARCIAMDAAYAYQPVRRIRTAEDVRDFEWATGGLHDAFIDEVQREGDAIRVRFAGCWGCRVEVVFAGDADCDTACREPETMDPYWLGSSVVLEDGFVWLIDDEDMRPELLNEAFCWFRGREMRWKILPD